MKRAQSRVETSRAWQNKVKVKVKVKRQINNLLLHWGELEKWESGNFWGRGGINVTRKMSGMHKVLDSSDQNFGVGYLVKVVGAGSCPDWLGTANQMQKPLHALG